MMKALNSLAAALLLVSAASLTAQEKEGIVLSAGILSPHGDALDLTGQSMRGYGFQVGYLASPAGYGVSFFPYFGHQIMQGKDKPDQTTYNLASNALGIDLVYKIEGTPVNLFTGPSFHQWQVERRGGNPVTANQGDQNWKLGWRLGCKYLINEDWSLSASFTQTQWRSRADEDYVPGLNPSRPAYWSLQVNYRF
ncbi:outer membrane beta-barrel protein [Geothrix sp. PMB-07]|uniref:outer membrane beta-barrel protein n=1 Tax=Geothrix sp. PMB-07 TaxID=3068640 RepID=UPI0027414975|nr:outer membrane beta-barrel protein [Geothrix sp. PMB-07]WLT30678.1 outer membrane beta-barrel protein [Geothrix sp. PMB-07]